MFFTIGGGIALALLTAGLISSVFHLGHPERGWRAFSQWRTSWLSREVIALPAFMAMTFIYTAAHYMGMSNNVTITIGVIGLVFDFALFVCTGMIYACLKFLKEWATPLTIVNFIFFGSASGFALAAVYSAYTEPAFANTFAEFAIVLTLGGMITRIMTLMRNAELKKQTLTTTQTAIGVRHPNVKQTSMGQMGGSYNTRDFFHHKTELFIKNIKTFFVLFAFVIPIVLHIIGIAMHSGVLFGLAFIIHFSGLIAERWHFFAQVNHPQNLYYQTVS
jgi:DMSO reductase anchor subunit